MAVQTLSASQYAALRRRYDAYHTARTALCGRRNYVTPEDAAQLPAAPSSDEIGAIEVYEFVHNRPDRYFAYVSPAAPQRCNGLTYSVRSARVTTWNGETLGEATLGAIYRSNMGDARRAIRVRAINGAVYVGTYYCDAGDYCRLRMAAASRRQYGKG